ncbi:hypothetical protein [Nocardiopsis alba]|uniref:Uncharacterized protein n=2 Tax=Nocardiopsis alba TaxID=53437 RepID=A0ABV5DPH2_9ACTN|nr:hypothetical protein [Nocardiopsis alba]AFR06932.1 hypothetical protein B005_4453 [Nocardiopsis alba ATCC BAA-2165]
MPPEIALIRWTEKNTAPDPDQDDLDDPLAELRSLHPHLLTSEQKELVWSESATPEPCGHHLGEPAERCGSTPSRLYQKGRRCFTHAPDPIAAPTTSARHRT